jgi:hypothetical protein
MKKKKKKKKKKKRKKKKGKRHKNQNKANCLTWITIAIPLVHSYLSLCCENKNACINSP